MEKDIEYRRQLVNGYKNEIQPLLKYIPWLMQKEGQKAGSMYAEEGIREHSMPIPVYDGTLMSFVKEVQKTNLLDRNYVYVYSRYRIKTVEDERRVIEKTTLMDMNNISGILSKYIMGGMTKSYLWSQGVEDGIFLQILLKMRAIVEFWDKPMEE